MTNKQKTSLTVAFLVQTLLVLALGVVMITTMKPENISGPFFVIFTLLNISCVFVVTIMENVTFK